MSAFAGIGSFAGQPITSQTLARIRQRLTWLGPDRQQTHTEQHVGMVQCSRTILPRERSTSGPLRCRHTGCVVAGDCRFDNRETLLASLGGSASGAPLSDLELVLAAYLRWGEQTPQHLLGDFAFAIWDPRARHFFCARDHMGTRPLYYHVAHAVFACATHPAALLEIPGVDHRVHEAHLACYLLQLVPEDTSTIYEAIQRLPPGHSLVATHDKVRLHEYWSPLHSRSISPRTFKEHAELFREIFIEAVRCRAVGPLPIGSTLSGGLDSSSIACVAARILQEEQRGPLHSFSAIFPSLPPATLARIDERHYMDVVQRQCGSIAHPVRADLIHPFASLQEDVFHVGQPFFGPNMYIHNALFAEAAQHGVTVFFDGTDGDSVLSYGFELFPYLLATGRWAALFSELKALKETSNSTLPLWRLFARYACNPHRETLVNMLQKLGIARPRLQKDLLAMLSPEFRKRIDFAQLLHRHHQRLQQPCIDAAAQHRASLAQPYLAHILEINFFFAARHGLDIRYPFLDKRLVEFCLTLPPEHKLHHGWSRAPQRQGMAGIVPDEVSRRLSKADLSPNYLNGATAQARHIFAELIEPSLPMLGAYLDSNVFKHRCQNLLQAGIHHPDTALTWYAVANFSAWLLHQRSSPEDIGD